MAGLEQEHKQLVSKHTEACSRLAELHKELEEEGRRLARVEAEVATLHVVNKGLRQDVERVSIVRLCDLQRVMWSCLCPQHKPFIARLASALQLDTGAAEIMSGEFAEEAVLSKINQLANHEVWEGLESVVWEGLESRGVGGARITWCGRG